MRTCLSFKAYFNNNPAILWRSVGTAVGYTTAQNKQICQVRSNVANKDCRLDVCFFFNVNNMQSLNGNVFGVCHDSCISRTSFLATTKDYPTVHTFPVSAKSPHDCLIPPSYLQFLNNVEYDLVLSMNEIFPLDVM